MVFRGFNLGIKKKPVDGDMLIKALKRMKEKEPEVYKDFIMKISKYISYKGN